MLDTHRKDVKMDLLLVTEASSKNGLADFHDLCYALPAPEEPYRGRGPEFYLTVFR
jgi:hypothetical protein